MLDLEALAQHRGSLLGDLPDEAQPSQKCVREPARGALERLDPSRPVFVESESQKIGAVQLPEALLSAMRAADCIRIDTPAPLRVACSKANTRTICADPSTLTARLAHLAPLHG